MAVTAAEVIALTGTSLDSATVDAVIADATLVVSENACYNAYEDARKDAIIKWLTAHLISSTSQDGSVTSEKLGDASVTYARAALGDGLKGTTYGQQVLLLDYNGCLTKLGRAKATFEVV